MQNLWKSSTWITSPKGYWTMQYEYRRSGVNMQYRFYWKVWLASGSWYYNGLKLKLFLNGVQHDITVKSYQSGVTGWSYDGTTEWYTVSNKTSGTVPFYAQIYDTNTKKTKSTSSTYYLSVSPSGATITSAPDFTDEQNPTIQYSNLAGNTVSSIEACISLTGEKDDVAYRNISTTGTSYTFSLTDEERIVLRKATSSNSRTVIFFVKTVIDDATFYSTLEKTFSIVNGNPTFTSSQISYADTETDVTNVTNNPLQIVQNQSSLAVTFEDATANKEATISKYEITVNGTTKTATKGGTVNFGKLNTSSNCDISIKVIDSRGNSVIATKNVEVLSWAEPVYSVKLERLNNYEDETYLTVDAKYSSVDSKNTVAISYKVKESGGKYGDSVTINNNETQTLFCDKNKSYILQIQVDDAFVSVPHEYSLPKGKFPLFIDTQKNAIGVNEFPAEDEALRVAGGIAHFDEGIKIGNSVVENYVVERGTDDIWTYEKWADGKAECWGIWVIENCNISVAWGYLFEPTEANIIEFPNGLFASAPVCNMNVQGSTAGVLSLETTGETTKEKTCYVYPTRATPATVNVIIGIRAIGKWK